jgi:hypothetical protein
VIRYLGSRARAGLPVHADFHDFYRDYEWMGAQRQLKVLGIFARLCHRDGKPAYLKDMPRVLAICAAPASATASCGRSRGCSTPSSKRRSTSAIPSDESDDPRRRPR